MENAFSSFETYGFPNEARFYGTIDVQKGSVHIRGELRPEYEGNEGTVPLEIVKHFDPRRLIPERNVYKLEQALDQDPVEVYELKIGKGAFTRFPEKVLSFKNLESLWIGGQAKLDGEALPDAFYQLTSLHTVQIYGGFKHNRLKLASPKIGQLTRLEELTIQGANLIEIPQEIGLLSALSAISFRSNQLVTLPENIGYLPHLQELNIEYNSFQNLPKSLVNIPLVKVDRKYKKLYMDTAYNSRNPNPIDDSLFDLSHYRQAREQLANAFSLPSTYNLYNHGGERFPKYAEYLENLEKDDLQYGHFEDNVTGFVEQLLEKHEPIEHKGPYRNFRTHSLNSYVFTQHESPEEQAAARFGGEPGELMVLLNMESIGEFSFMDAGTLSYCIHKKDLGIADFSKVHSSIESS